MRDLIEKALRDVIGTEQLHLVTDSVALFETIGLSTPSDELQSILERQDGVSDTALFVSRINDIIFIAYDEVFKRFGVTVIDEAPLAFKIALLETLTSLEYYIIPEQIQMLYKAPFTNEEIIAHLIPIFSTFNLEQSMDYLESVSDATVERLALIIENKLMQKDPEGLNPPADNTARLARLNKLIKFKGAQELSIVYSLAQAGVRAGRPLKALLSQHIEALEGLEPQRLTTELLALTLFSDTSLDHVKTQTHELINEFEENIGRLRQMEMALNPLIQAIEY